MHIPYTARVQAEQEQRNADMRWAAESGDDLICWINGLPRYRSRLHLTVQALEAALQAKVSLDT